MAEPDPFPDFAELFSPLFGGKTTKRTEGDRTVASLHDHGYRGGDDRRKVTLRRRVRCGCAEGCKACGRVGWTLKEETLTVIVPTAVALGSKVRIEGKGDDLAIGTLVATGDLFVEVTEDAARAQEIRAAQLTHEADLELAWTKESRARAFARKKTIVHATLFIGLPLALVVGFWTKEHFDQRALGETCARASDCRSGDCLGVVRGRGPLEGANPDHFTSAGIQVCTVACASDGDCPDSMRCADVERAPFMPAPPGRQDNRACAPR